jgi:hypothetical protein
MFFRKSGGYFNSNIILNNQRIKKKEKCLKTLSNQVSSPSSIRLGKLVAKHLMISIPKGIQTLPYNYIVTSIRIHYLNYEADIL